MVNVVKYAITALKTCEILCGFNNIFRVEYEVVNVEQLAQFSGETIDISPASQGNRVLGTYAAVGHDRNPVTGDIEEYREP